jgi:hypothetical protein
MLRQSLICALLWCAAQLAYAGQAGQVIFVAGTVTADNRALALGAPVQEGELLSTGANGYLYIKTVDNGLFILRPNSRARMAAYQIDKANPAKTNVKLEQLSGVVRYQSGEGVKKARQNFRFNTPVAAIGVRGTDFTVFTDEHTLRVSVLSGGITISGFDGACSPEGNGPCEGSGSRELFAQQKGQLLQIQRGKGAAQLIKDPGLAPDTVAPPRGDEPVGVKEASAGGAQMVSPALDPLKAVDIKKNANLAPSQPQPGGNANPPVDVPAEPPPVVQNPTQPEVPRVPVVEPVPVVPEKTVIWGRFAEIAASAPVQISFAEQAAAKNERMALYGYYVLYRTPGKDYVTPERGNVSFMLKDSEAYIFSDNVTVKPVKAGVENGQLSFDFDKKSFATSLEVVSNLERFKLNAAGSVASDGRFSVDNRYAPGNNMGVDGVLSAESGLGAAYLFQADLAGGRSVNGVTTWTK